MRCSNELSWLYVFLSVWVVNGWVYFSLSVSVSVFCFCVGVCVCVFVTMKYMSTLLGVLRFHQNRISEYEIRNANSVCSVCKCLIWHVTFQTVYHDITTRIRVYIGKHKLRDLIFSFETTIVGIWRKSSVTKMSGLLVDYWITGLLIPGTLKVPLHGIKTFWPDHINLMLSHN